MREICRICARELCGNQRRWIFHTAAKLNLQVLLSHVLGKELCRDGKAEFACSKCAFMLDRIYRFDTVIARIEALSIERLQKLLLEKDRLKFCIASMYRRNNEDSGIDDKVVGDLTVDISGLPDVRYTALLQEDFAYSGFECWTEHEEHIPELHSCHTLESVGNRPRRCHGCATLRVADSDYEAICRVPRKVARSISCGLSTRWPASVCNEESSVCEPITADLASAKVPVEEESMEEGTPGSSVESLDTAVKVSPPRQKDEEADKGVKGSEKCDDCLDAHTTPNSSLYGNRLELALSLIKAFDYKPVQSPRGSRLPIPVKSILLYSKPSRNLVDGSTLLGSVNAGSGFPSATTKPFPLELSDLLELWDDLGEDYMPLRVQNLPEDHQQLTQCDPVASGRVSESHAAELQDKIQQYDATNKLLQEKLNEMNFELKSIQEASQRKDRTIQSLNEALKSKESETEELYHVIEGQNETMGKLRDMLHRSQLGHLQTSEGPSPSQQQQHMALLDLQNTLFCTQLEMQKLKRAQWQKEHQLAEARRTTQLLEATVQEEQQLKEVSWKHNQELRGVVQQVQAELQGKVQELWALEREKCCEIRAQEQRVQRLSQRLAHKEQLLQESWELLQRRQSLEKNPVVTDTMLEKLQQRIKDRDAALERAIDEKFCAVEEKEQELRQLHISVREREHDLERLRCVLSSNEATIHSMESLLKAKTLELEQVTATCQNLQWLKEEVEAKSSCWQKEQEGIIQQLQASLHDRNKEVEELTATLLCKLGPGQSEIAEELCLCLQRKERMLQDLLSDRNRQAGKHETELRELLQAMSIREQRSRVAAEKMVQALAEKSDEVQFLRQRLVGNEPGKNPVADGRLLLQKDKQPFQELLPGGCGNATATGISKGEDSKYRMERGLLETAAELEKELINAREELELMARKERESRLELSSLQSVVTAQEEELQVQASDIESLTRNIQSKEDLIKDLQMQLVDPEEIPAVERLTQEVLVLREKVATAESRGQETTGNRQQQLLLMLEGLVAEKSRLNEALQAERQLYSSLVKFHAHPDSPERGQTLQAELEGAQALRGRLEESLGRSMEHLRRLETLGAFGGQPGRDDAKDGSTDSIEGEAPPRTVNQQTSQGLPANSPEAKAAQPDLLTLAPLERDSSLQAELLHVRAKNQQLLEQKAKVEGELWELKALMEEAGFSSLSPIRKVLLSLCLETAELKEQLGGSPLSEGWEDKAEARAALCTQNRKLQSSETVVTLLKEQLVLNCPEGKSKFPPQLVTGMATEIDRLRAEMGVASGKRPALEGQLQEDPAKRPCPRSQAVELGPAQAPRGMSQMEACPAGSWQQLVEPRVGPSGQLVQCRQRNQELQDKLAVSEATVRAQAEQLEQYKTLLSEPLVQQDNKQVQVDLQDLGYETCGRSENEADREETPSPECEEPDVFSKADLMEELSRPGPRGGLCWGQSEDVAVLQQHVRELQLQLQNSNKALQRLQRRTRSFSSTSDYASGAERLHKPVPSATDEDEGWQSDGVGAFCPPALQASRDLEWLIHRVSLLEAQLPGRWAGGVLPEKLRSAVWPGKYDSLIQAQARELSHLRQKMREGRSVCHLLTQHLRDTVKSFEELLRGTDIDYYMGQSFREHLAQGGQLAERLSSKLSSRDRSDVEDKTGHEFVALRLSKELREKERMIETLQAKLQELCETPSSSRALSESPRSNSSASFLSDGPEACSDGDASSEYSQLQGDRSEQPSRRLTDVTHPAALASNPSPAAAPHQASAESIRGYPTGPSSQHPPMDSGQTRTGLHFDSLSKPLSVPLTPAPGPSAFLPFGPPPPTPSALLGCCGTPVFSLAEVQQELHMLQKQLGERGPLAAPPVKPLPLTSDFGEASTSRCLHVPHLTPQSCPLQSSAQLDRKAGAAFLESNPLWAQPPMGALYGHLPSGYPASHKLTGADLLEGHLAEIRSLRQRLEESICINDRLREQLEKRLATTAKGNGYPTNIYIQGLESASSLSSETQALREENQSLQLQFAHLSRGNGALPPELEQLRETTRCRLQKAETENRTLAQELAEQRQSGRQLREERLALQENNHRLECTVPLLQQQCEENQRLCQALCAELRIHETLSSSSQAALSACSGDVHRRPPSSSELGALLAEVRTLRRQLLRGIQVNSALRQQLARQQPEGSAAPLFAAHQATPNWQPFQDSSPSPPVRDVGMSSPAPLSPPALLSGPAPLAHQLKEPPVDDALVRRSAPAPAGDAPSSSSASKGGCQVIGHVDDYYTLKQQILDGKMLVHQMASLLRPALAMPCLEPRGTEALDRSSVQQLLSTASALHQLLEQCSSLLTTFWRGALLVAPSPAQPQTAEQAMKDELLALRARLAEQENLLQRAAERLQDTCRLKDNMEHFIVSHLTQTHAVLRKARTNLESLQKSKPQGSSVKSPPSIGAGEISVGLSQHPSHVIPTNQEHRRKRSCPDTLKWQEDQSWPCFVHLPSS
ncbi:myomegalin isoform X2 [Gopherus flavomarginatus]|uniref:myomegalin isoform X2 n=1 Tax=Gopherus flavomarginatus TaxID=286002 RepID=UPI0021CBEC54|nr:myomegalin isoform X2 [Gopherus flavomarginatus]